MALHTFSHHHVSGSDSDPNNQNDMQIYVRVPLRKRRGLIVTLSYDGQKEQCKIRNRKEKIKFITNLSIETNCTRTAHGPSNGSIHHSDFDFDFNFNFNCDAAAATMRQVIDFVIVVSGWVCEGVWGRDRRGGDAIGLSGNKPVNRHQRDTL